jgi:hypothetical protein
MATLKNTNINDTGYLHLPVLTDGGSNSNYALGGVTLSNSATGLGVARNGLQLYIDPAATNWGKYENLPEFLLGLPCTLNINDSANITVELDQESTVYLLRQPGWSAVSTTGWTQIVDAYGINLIDSYSTSDWDIWQTTLAAGSHNLDNNSAMYFFSMGTEGEIRYNAGRDGLEFFGKPHISERGRWQSMTVPFAVRQIITTAYTAGGYKDSTVWSNVNRTNTATDSTTNLGDNKVRGFNYQSSICNKDNMFVMGAGGGHVVSTNYVTGFSMRTENNISHQNKWDLIYSDVRQGSMWNSTDYGYTLNGGRIQEWNMATETAANELENPGTGDSWAMSGENVGHFWAGYQGATARTFDFSTRSSSARGGTSPSNSHQQKTVNSKWEYQWAGNEGGYNGGYNLRRTNMYTNTTSGTRGKPSGNSGEENFTMGQHHQYMIGMYNGLQNNISWRWNYANESGFQGGSSMEPKGHAGMSSGASAWRD